MGKINNDILHRKYKRLWEPVWPTEGQFRKGKTRWEKSLTWKQLERFKVWSALEGDWVIDWVYLANIIYMTISRRRSRLPIHIPSQTLLYSFICSQMLFCLSYWYLICATLQGTGRNYRHGLVTSFSSSLPRVLESTDIHGWPKRSANLVDMCVFYYWIAAVLLLCRSDVTQASVFSIDFPVLGLSRLVLALSLSRSLALSLSRSLALSLSLYLSLSRSLSPSDDKFIHIFVATYNLPLQVSYLTLMLNCLDFLETECRQKSKYLPSSEWHTMSDTTGDGRYRRLNQLAWGQHQQTDYISDELDWIHCTDHGLPRHNTASELLHTTHGCNVFTWILSRDPVKCELLQHFETSPEEAETVEWIVQQVPADSDCFVYSCVCTTLR